MNTAFNITPAALESRSLHLLIEVGRSGISFLWFTRESFSVKALAIYNFTTPDILPDIQSIFDVHQQFLSKLASVTVCYDFKESVLVPARYHQGSTNEEAINVMFGNEQDVVLSHDLITSMQVYNHYRIPKQVEALFSKRFPAANIFHSTSLQLEQLNNERELMYCIIYHNAVKCILFRSGTLQFVQQYSFTNPTDLSYFLLNVCKQHHANATELQLRLSGMIDKSSRLYNELGQYFPKIDFASQHETVYGQEEIKNIPAHFISHLTAMALCVS